MKVSVILPAYNEAENIPGLISQLNSALSGDYEIIVVDDASTDATGGIAEAAGARVISHPYNIGNGAAVKTGIRAAQGEWIMLMDADGQHNPSQVQELLDNSSGYDMVVGSRGKDSPQPCHRKLANSIYNAFASYAVGMKVKDLTSGFRAIKRAKAMKFLYLLPNTFSYPSTLTLSFIKAGLPVKFVPIKVEARKAGKSKINILSDGARFFLIIIRIATFFSPLKVFLPTAAFFFITGLSYYLYTFSRYHRFTNMSALLFITSVIIFMLGLVSEQIAHLRMEKTED